MTPHGKVRDGIYRRGCLSVFFFFFWCCEWIMKIGMTDHIPIFLFSVFELGKRKRKLDYPTPIFHYGIGERKTKGRYVQHIMLFRFSCFHLAKEKNENLYNRSYFYFSFFFVWELGKRKRLLSHPISIFYYEIEKRKTKGRYIHGPIHYDVTWILICHTICQAAHGAERQWEWILNTCAKVSIGKAGNVCGKVV